MTYFSERRKYQRCSGAVCKAMVMTDKMRWRDIELCDISAGGLKFAASSPYDAVAPINLHLTVHNMLSEFEMKLEGHIVRMEERKGGYTYSVKFDRINKYNQVQLDEVIKSKISVYTNRQPVAEDGIYTFLFLPRIRPSSFRGKLKFFK
ncbi:MAG: PilZ domain-containing protein [Clostridia bacterium]|nr:PilZ domain-containing protein [Clostridia bacterium]